MNKHEQSFDIWLHLSALEGIERAAVERILKQEFSERSASQLVRTLYKLRIGHMKEAHQREVEIEATK